MKIPTIHLNGSGKARLTSQLEEAHNALTNALEKLQDAAPHGRDYYPQGDDAYTEAAREHVSRLSRLLAVRDELVAMWEAIEEVQRA